MRLHLHLSLLFGLAVSQATIALADDDLQRHLPEGRETTRDAPTPTALTTAILARSDALFDAIFTDCAPEVVGDMISADFEFHHDRWGTIADSRDAFVAHLRQRCARQASDEDTASRRERVPGTTEVFPMGADAALETGIHRFHERHGRDEILVGIARYSHLWRREDGVWRVSRILSYAHLTVH